MLEIDTPDRAANVKDMARRIASFGEGLSVREFFDACALAAGGLMKAYYESPQAREVAVNRHIEALRRAAKLQ